MKLLHHLVVAAALERSTFKATSVSSLTWRVWKMYLCGTCQRRRDLVKLRTWADEGLAQSPEAFAGLRADVSPADANCKCVLPMRIRSPDCRTCLAEISCR